MKFKSILLTAIQFISIGLMVILFPIMTADPIIMSIQITGLLIGFSALLVMLGSRLNITPEPLMGSTLITSGPYKYIRHPMYLTLILVFTPPLFINFTVWFAVVYIVFIVNQLLKLHFEEHLLKQHFEHYTEYRKHTWKLVPFIF